MKVKKVFLSSFIFCLCLLVSSISIFAYSYSGKKWSTNNVTYVFNSTVPDAWKNEIINGAWSWNGLSKFNLANNGSSSNVIQALNNGYSSGAIATTTTTYTGSTIIGATTVFNTYFSFGTNGSSSVYDVRSVAAHEFGHWLRLLDEYSDTDKSNVMYAYLSAGQIKRYLTSDDTYGIQSIYGN